MDWTELHLLAEGFAQRVQRSEDYKPTYGLHLGPDHPVTWEEKAYIVGTFLQAMDESFGETHGDSGYEELGLAFGPPDVVREDWVDAGSSGNLVIGCFLLDCLIPLLKAGVLSIDVEKAQEFVRKNEPVHGRLLFWS